MFIHTNNNDNNNNNHHNDNNNNNNDTNDTNDTNDNNIIITVIIAYNSKARRVGFSNLGLAPAPVWSLVWSSYLLE